MADNKPRQFLKHGKALCDAVFPDFEETWNWVVNFCRNLAGDAENGRGGTLTVDRTNPNSPVIVSGAVAAPAQGKTERRVPGPFEPVFENGQLSSVGAGLWPWGRSFNSYASVENSAKVATGFIWLRIDHPEDGAQPTAAICRDDSDNPPTDAEKTYLPLYQIEDGKMVRDYRCLMSLAIRE